MAFDHFWRQNPALLYGIAIGLGCAVGLGHFLEPAIIAAALVLPLLTRRFFFAQELMRRLAIAFALCGCVALWVQYAHHFPELPPYGIKGTGRISLSSVVYAKHPFGGRWVYRGTLHDFTPEGGARPLRGAKNIPLTISLPEKEGLRRPPATNGYLIPGLLKKSGDGKYTMRTSVQTKWIPLAGTETSAEMRYGWKQSVGAAIRERYQSPESRAFLTGMATGAFDDKLLAQNFNRFGLQHMMAISGFHFAIIAGFFSFFLKMFLSRRTAILILVFMLTSYFLFLGATASIMRAWAMCVGACLGVMLERKTYGLNTLGVALIAVLSYDPLLVSDLGFQFSFTVTAAILLLLGCVDGALQGVFKKRALQDAMAMPLLDRHAYIILSSLRQGISLALVVNAIAIPLTLFYFLKFPWMGLLFNLFFPFFVSLAIILLLIGTGVGVVLPPLGRWVDSVNDAYTQMALNLTTYTPRAFDHYLRISECPSWMPVALIALIFVAGIHWRHRSEAWDNGAHGWPFI